MNGFQNFLSDCFISVWFTPIPHFETAMQMLLSFSIMKAAGQVEFFQIRSSDNPFKIFNFSPFAQIDLCYFMHSLFKVDS